MSDTSAAVIRWEAPPASATAERANRRSTRRSRYEPIADALRTHPGEWAVVFEGGAGAGGAMVTHVRFGQMQCFCPTGDFDATSRSVGGRTVVYARYLGDGDGEAGHG